MCCPSYHWPHPKIGGEVYDHLFSKIVKKTNQIMGIDKAMTEGVSTAVLLQLIKFTSAEVEREFDIGLTYDLPLLKGRRLPVRATLARLRPLAQQPNSALIVGLGGDLDHWSVALSVGQGFLKLFDSNGTSHIWVSRIRMSHEKRLRAAVECVIGRGSVIHLSRAAS
jgi:hypothetical protein